MAASRDDNYMLFVLEAEELPKVMSQCACGECDCTSSDEEEIELIELTKAATMEMCNVGFLDVSDLYNSVKKRTLGNDKLGASGDMNVNETKIVLHTGELASYFGVMWEGNTTSATAWRLLLDNYLDYETQKKCRLVCRALNFYLINSVEPNSFKSRTCFTFNGLKKSVNQKSAKALHGLLGVKFATHAAMVAIQKNKQERLLQFPDDTKSAAIQCKTMLLMDLTSWSQMNIINVTKASLLNQWMRKAAMKHVTTLVLKNCLLDWSDLFREIFMVFDALSSFSFIVTPDVKDLQAKPIDHFACFAQKLEVDIELREPGGDLDFEELMPCHITTRLLKKSPFFTSIDAKKLKASLSNLRSLNLDLIYLEFTNMFLLLFDHAKCSTLEKLSIRVGRKHLFTWPKCYHVLQKGETSPRLNLKGLLTQNQLALTSVTIEFANIPGGTDIDTNPIAKLAQTKRSCCCCAKLIPQESKELARLMGAVAIVESKNNEKRLKKVKRLFPNHTLKIKESNSNLKEPDAEETKTNTKVQKATCSGSGRGKATSHKLPEEIANTSFRHFIAIADMFHLHYLVQNLEHVELRLGLITFQFADDEAHENLFIRSLYNRLVSFVKSQRRLKTFIITEICWTINVEEQLGKLVPLHRLARVHKEGVEEDIENGTPPPNPEELTDKGIDTDVEIYVLCGFINEACKRNYPNWNILQKYCSRLKLQWVFYDFNRLGALFEDDSTEIMPYMKRFELINDTPHTFTSYDFDIICRVFPCLQELHLEDVPPECSTQAIQWSELAKSIHGPFQLAEVNDDDLLLIFSQLTSLKRLFIKLTKCNVTDYGLTELELNSEGPNPQVLMKTYEDMKMPLENLKNLESFTLIGENKISNVSAYLAFNKGLCRLKELNLGTNTAITKKGKKFLRQKFVDPQTSNSPAFKLTV